MKAGIIGAGIMGRLLSMRLIQSGWDVTLFDKNKSDSTQSCSHVAAGLLAPISELDKAETIITQLGLTAIKIHWPSILRDLSDTIYFNTLGSVVLHHPQDEAEWQSFKNQINYRLNPSYYQLLSDTDLRQLEPELLKFNTAYYFPDEGQIDSQAVLSALGDYLNQSIHITWKSNTSVLAIEPGKVITANQIELFDIVFDCRGLNAKSTFPNLRGLRGELIWLYAPEVTLHRPIRFLHPRYRLYLIPRPHSIYLIGASELETEDESPISVRTALELLTCAYYIHPGFAEARIIQTATACRPTLTHHLPQIQYADQFIGINGLYRHGYLIAPTLVEEILQWVNTRQINPKYSTLWEPYHNHYLS